MFTSDKLFLERIHMAVTISSFQDAWKVRMTHLGVGEVTTHQTTHLGVGEVATHQTTHKLNTQTTTWNTSYPLEYRNCSTHLSFQVGNKPLCAVLGWVVIVVFTGMTAMYPQ